MIALIEFEKVLKAKGQIVSGKSYYLTLEIIDYIKRKIYEAKTWAFHGCVESAIHSVYSCYIGNIQQIC